MDYQWCYANPTKAAAEIERLRAALSIFALDANWRLNHRCDPNSPHFDGLTVAKTALGN